jgi:ABC-2 type transport system permease protein
MKKILLITQREYLAAVRSKAFLASLILMPLMMLAGAFSQRLSKSIADTNAYKIAIVDRSPGQTVLRDIRAAAETRNANSITGADGKQNAPRYEIVSIDPADFKDKAAVDKQRLDLADRMKKEEFVSIIEIGENVAKRMTLGGMLQSIAASANTGDESEPATKPTSPAAAPDDFMNAMNRLNDIPDENIVRYTTNRPTLGGIRTWLQMQVQRSVVGDLMERVGGNRQNVALPILVDKGMPRLTSSGQVSYEDNRASAITNMLVPIALVILMLMVTLVGTSPLTTNILEEKSQRIAEVLMGSVTPFQLMMGKLMGGVTVALTLSTIYLVGIYFAAQQYNLLQYVKPELIGWFLVLTVLATLLFGALFTAAGAAVTNVKEAQAIITPVILIVMAPMFVFSVLIEYPNGGLAKALTFIPFTAPMVTMLRLSIPPSIPMWEAILAVTSCLIGIGCIIWIAGRVFRVGMLMNTKPAGFGELIRWVTKG